MMAKQLKVIDSTTVKEINPLGEYTDRELEEYYPCNCKKCGWLGLSKDAAGGNQIADTGDYGDPECPECGTTDIDVEKEWHQIEDSLKEYRIVGVEDLLFPIKIVPGIIHGFDTDENLLTATPLMPMPYSR